MKFSTGTTYLNHMPRMERLRISIVAEATGYRQQTAGKSEELHKGAINFP